jgi:hypothetical protein
VDRRLDGPSLGPAVDHYVVAARPHGQFHKNRVIVQRPDVDRSPRPSSTSLAAALLRLGRRVALWVTNRFRVSEYRCDTTSCKVPSDALNVKARN